MYYWKYKGVIERGGVNQLLKKNPKIPLRCQHNIKPVTWCNLVNTKYYVVTRLIIIVYCNSVNTKYITITQLV